MKGAGTSEGATLDNIEYDKILCKFESDILSNYKQSKYISCSGTVLANDNVVSVDELNKVLSVLKVLVECGKSYKIVRYYPRTNGRFTVMASAHTIMVGIVTTNGKMYRFWCIKENQQRASQKEERTPNCRY